MVIIKQLFDKLHELYPQLVEIRRDLHMYPEVSNNEVETPKKISEYLISLGIKVKTGVGGNGVVGYLQGGKPGKTIALRADFDALPIQDEKDVPYKSKVPGVMHACGHDIHTTALLGVAHVLSRVKENIIGTVVFIHQFAEEVAPGGAELMIRDGCLDGVDEIYGAHVWSNDSIGQVSFHEGFTMAAADTFEITITGNGGHGAMPHETVDPVVIASQLVLNLQQIASRKTDPLKSIVVTIGSIKSGEALNVIPDTAYIGGTVRSFDEDVRNEAEKLIRHISGSTCHVFGANTEVKYNRGHAALYNHPNETKKLKSLTTDFLGKAKVFDKEPIMCAEDFSYYLRKAPGTFFFVGGGNPEIDAVFPHHHPHFNVDERSIITIGQVFLSLISHELIDKKDTLEVQPMQNLGGAPVE
ncbi:M20 family metallopeptidase [Pseudalkalibacillus sp. A8]|uniref:M20 metallopeptidase family protein n=1 Tax=Pseudalkalibacillus sp. A8 TaxID=3382641 RepID=UPI0038B4BDD7